MLIIIDQGKYQEFQKVKSRKKPSEFCKTDLRIGYKKSHSFVYEYFSGRPERLLKAIREYARLTVRRNGELMLADLLKESIS